MTALVLPYRIRLLYCARAPNWPFRKAVVTIETKVGKQSWRIGDLGLN